MSERLQALHCPVDIGGNASGLARAQRELGLVAEMVSLTESPLGFNGDVVLTRADSAVLARECARFALLRRALRHDIIHFYFGQTILTPRRFPKEVQRPDMSLAEMARSAYARALWMRDLPLLRAAGKTIAMTFLGDDARLVSHARKHHQRSHLHDPEIARILMPRDDTKRRMVAYVDRYAHLIYATNPDLLETLPARARFLPYCSIDHRGTRKPITANGPLIVGHAPTHRKTKGTDVVLAAVEEVRRRGHRLEFRLIEGVHHQTARAIIATLDIFVDQLLVGWFGGAAVEAMSSGAVAMAYLRESDERRSPYDPGQLPVVRTTPETLADDLERLLLLPRQDLEALSARSFAFARSAFDPVTVARAVVADYRSVRAGKSQ